MIELVAARKAKTTAEADQLREEMAGQCNGIIDDLGDEIAGYAFVVWDRSGDMRTVYNAKHGPIKATLVPTLVADALNRHLSVCVMRAEMTKAE